MNANQDDLIAALDKELQRQIDLIGKEEAEKAGKEVERRVREKVSTIIGNVSNYYSYERFGTDLRITVHFPSKV